MSHYARTIRRLLVYALLHEHDTKAVIEAAGSAKSLPLPHGYKVKLEWLLNNEPARNYSVYNETNHLVFSVRHHGFTPAQEMAAGFYSYLFGQMMGSHGVNTLTVHDEEGINDLVTLSKISYPRIWRMLKET